MPINCPLPFGEIMVCEECRYLWGDKCNWFFPAMLLTEVLTLEERMEIRPQAEVKHLYIYEHSNISARQAMKIATLQNQYSSLKEIFNEHIDTAEKKRTEYVIK